MSLQNIVGTAYLALAVNFYSEVEGSFFSKTVKLATKIHYYLQLLGGKEWRTPISIAWNFVCMKTCIAYFNNFIELENNLSTKNMSRKLKIEK